MTGKTVGAKTVPAGRETARGLMRTAALHPRPRVRIKVHLEHVQGDIGCFLHLVSVSPFGKSPGFFSEGSIICPFSVVCLSLP